MTIFAVNAEQAEQRESIAWLAAEAMYQEVRLTPKPGWLMARTMARIVI
ncbi:MAG: hypothetical protein ACLR17_01935 [Enterobacteriaceae bacterium]